MEGAVEEDDNDCLRKLSDRYSAADKLRFARAMVNGRVHDKPRHQKVIFDRFWKVVRRAALHLAAVFEGSQYPYKQQREPSISLDHIRGLHPWITRKKEATGYRRTPR